MVLHVWYAKYKSYIKIASSEKLVYSVVLISYICFLLIMYIIQEWMVALFILSKECPPQSHKPELEVSDECHLSGNLG